MKLQKILGTLLKDILAFAMSAIMLIPIALVFINSLKTKGESTNMTFALPAEFQWGNYIEVFQKAKLGVSFWNSMFYSTAAVVLIVIFASMAAYVLSRNQTKTNKAIYIYIVLGLTLTLNHIALIKIMQVLHLLDTRFGIILLYTALQIPFAVFLLYSFISSVPREVDEAGIVDGCGPLRLYFQIIFPNLKPALVSVAILNFLNTWNEFTLPLYYLNSSSKWPMTNSIYTFYGQYSASWHLVSADIVLTSLPVIIIYLLGQKYIVSGMAVGAVKG